MFLSDILMPFMMPLSGMFGISFIQFTKFLVLFVVIPYHEKSIQQIYHISTRRKLIDGCGLYNNVIIGTKSRQDVAGLTPGLYLANVTGIILNLSPGSSLTSDCSMALSSA